MSFSGYKLYIEEGDVAILYINPFKMFAIDVKLMIPDKNGRLVENIFQTMYGSLKVSSLIGKKFGSKILLSRGWAYILHPTSELWTALLPHRTQILYTPDISMVLFQLDLFPGKVVIESGTGSGSVTHSLARTISPNGHVYTFEFHESRQQKAVEEFALHKLSNVVTVTLRNVCEQGFGEEMNHKADAVFLDLPSPWEAVKHAVKCFKKKGGRIASFSPCIEQVQKVCLELKALGFVDIITMECHQRELTVSEKNLSAMSLDWRESPKPVKTALCIPAQEQIPGHTGFLTFATLPPDFSRSASGVVQQPVKITEMEIENVVLDENFHTEPVSMISMSCSDLSGECSDRLL